MLTQLVTSANTFTVATADGTQIFVQRWGAPQAGGRTLLVVHGLGEHSSRYAHLPQHLSDTFSEVYALDLRGHGRSSGIRGYAPSIDTMLDDIKVVSQDICKRSSKKTRHYLFGHSMGGLLTLRYLQRERAAVGFAAAFISAPFLGLAMKVPSWKQGLGRVLSSTLAKIQLSNEINPSHISHDPAVVEAYVNDRLVHNKITPRLYFDLLNAHELVKSDLQPLPCPTLFLIPGEDKLVDSGASLAFYEALKDRHKSLRQYPGFYHEIVNETNKELVFNDMKQWLAEQDL